MIPSMQMVRSLIDWTALRPERSNTYIFYRTRTSLTRYKFLQCEKICTSVRQLYSGKSPDDPGSQDSPSMFDCIWICWEWIKKNFSFGTFPLLALAVYLIYIGPLLAYGAYLSSSSSSNLPKEAYITVSIAGYQPLFTTKAVTSRSIQPLSDKEKEDNDWIGDVAWIAFDGTSLSNWGINTASRRALEADLENDTFLGKLELSIEVGFKREADYNHDGSIYGWFPTDLRLDKYREVRKNLTRIMKDRTNDTVTIHQVFPRFIQLGKGAEVSTIDDLLEGMGQSNISLRYVSDETHSYSEWWDVEEILMGPSVFKYEAGGNISKVPQINFITFNDNKMKTSLLTMFSIGNGVLAAYALALVLLYNIFQHFFGVDYTKIMFEEVQNPKPLIHLCQSIYDMRVIEEPEMEERLFELLIKLYGSRQLMENFTKV